MGFQRCALANSSADHLFIWPEGTSLKFCIVRVFSQGRHSFVVLLIE